MNPQEWNAARKLINRSLSVTVCTVDSEGGPHATPIGSLMLHPSEPRGYWLEKYTTGMPRNLEEDNRIQILVTESGMVYWFKSLWKGAFASAPALRLKGTAGPLRRATDSEINRFLKKVKYAKSLKGHGMLWTQMAMARDVSIEEILPVKVGKMWPPGK